MLCRMECMLLHRVSVDLCFPLPTSVVNSKARLQARVPTEPTQRHRRKMVQGWGWADLHRRPSSRAWARLAHLRLVLLLVRTQRRKAMVRPPCHHALPRTVRLWEVPAFVDPRSRLDRFQCVIRQPSRPCQDRTRRLRSMVIHPPTASAWGLLELQARRRIVEVDTLQALARRLRRCIHRLPPQRIGLLP